LALAVGFWSLEWHCWSVFESTFSLPAFGDLNITGRLKKTWRACPGEPPIERQQARQTETREEVDETSNKVENPTFKTIYLKTIFLKSIYKIL